MNDIKNHVINLISGISVFLTLIPSVSFSQKAPLADIEHNTRTIQEFTMFDPDYVRMKAERVARVKAAYLKVKDLESAGKNTNCSHQILWELKALLTTTGDSSIIDKRLKDLDSSLVHPKKETLAMVQDPADGSYGRCFDEWYCKLDAFYDEISKNIK